VLEILPLIDQSKEKDMSFQKGAATFRVFSSGKDIGESIQEGLRAFAYKTLPTEGEQDGPLFDITRGVSLMGTGAPPPVEFVYGGNTFFAIRKREKIINPALVKECLSYLIDKDFKETGKAPWGKRKKELKETARDMAKGEGVLKIGGTRVVIIPNTKFLLMDATSVSKVDDALNFLISGPLPDYTLIQITPEVLYAYLAKKESSQYQPIKVFEKSLTTGVGVDFLTWLWAISENDSEGGNGDKINVSLCGDISFRCDESGTAGSQITKLSKGAPWNGDEPKAAFEDGKKVSSATFRFCKGTDVFETTLDESLLFNKFKRILEEEDEDAETDDSKDGKKKSKKRTINPEESFSDRIIDMKAGADIVIELFKRFVAAGDKVQKNVDDWMTSKW